MKPLDLSSRYQPDLDKEIRSMVGDSSLPLYHMMRYHLGWVDVEGKPRLTKGGKLLRPSLCLLSCQSVGSDWHKALPAAAALELLHNFSLIHDDIEDGDRERRGIPTVWSVWGEAQGINAGDAMHVLSRLALLKLDGKGTSPQKVLRAGRLLDETCLKLCEGQYLDISYESRMDIGVEDYLKMIEGKTAALFSCSIQMGALMGTDDEPLIERLAKFGKNLGLAFQIQDDILGIWGEREITGKPVASDILKKKKTLPVVYSLSKASPTKKSELHRIYTQKIIRTNDTDAVMEVLDSVGARQYATTIARRYSDEALDDLGKADISPAARDEFQQLVEFIIGRQY